MLASLAVHVAAAAALVAAGNLTPHAVAPDRDVVPVNAAAAPAVIKRLRVETGQRLPDAEAVVSTPAIPLDSDDPRYQPYLSGVQRRIWERWRAPELKAGEEAKGSLIVEFAISRGGALLSAVVQTPSGAPALDRAAIDAVVGSAPFRSIPESVPGGMLRVSARFVYE